MLREDVEHLSDSSFLNTRTQKQHKLGFDVVFKAFFCMNSYQKKHSMLFIVVKTGLSMIVKFFWGC